MNEELSISIEGLDELADSFKNLAKKYPDRAGELLQNNAKELRKEVVQNVKKETKFNRENKKSLARVGSYRISPIMGYREKQFVEISAKSPHFHLVEHGHENIMPPFHGIKGQKGVRIPNKNAGEKIGFVQGKHIMAAAVKKTEKEMPGTLSNMVDELLREGGFL